MKRASWIVAVAVAVLLPACGEDSTTAPPPVGGASPSPSPSATPVPSPTPEPSPSPVPSPTPEPTPEPLPDITINIVGMTFSPSAVTAKQGQRIIWRNRDTATHTATGDAGEFNTGFIDPGGQASIRIDFVGEVNYHCSVHPSMRASLTGEN